MYTTNLIIAHNVNEKAQLHLALDRVCSVQNCGIRHGAEDALHELYFVHPQTDDFCFELFDLSDTDSSGLFLSTNYILGTSKHQRELYLINCFEILKDVVDTTLAFCSDVEIFITKNRASMEDFFSYEVETSKLTELLHGLFRDSLSIKGIDPEIHLFIRHKSAKGPGHCAAREMLSSP